MFLMLCGPPEFDAEVNMDEMLKLGISSLARVRIFTYLN